MKDQNPEKQNDNGMGEGGLMDGAAEQRSKGRKSSGPGKAGGRRIIWLSASRLPLDRSDVRCSALKDVCPKAGHASFFA